MKRDRFVFVLVATTSNFVSFWKLIGQPSALKKGRRISRIRRSPARASPKTSSEYWDPGDLLFLVHAINSGMALPHVAMFLRRTPDEVSEKAKQLKLVVQRVH